MAQRGKAGFPALRLHQLLCGADGEAAGGGGKYLGGHRPQRRPAQLPLVLRRGHLPACCLVDGGSGAHQAQRGEDPHTIPGSGPDRGAGGDGGCGAGVRGRSGRRTRAGRRIRGDQGAVYIYHDPGRG